MGNYIRPKRFGSNVFGDLYVIGISVFGLSGFFLSLTTKKGVHTTSPTNSSLCGELSVGTSP